jgi:VWFA-related protein
MTSSASAPGSSRRAIAAVSALAGILSLAPVGGAQQQPVFRSAVDMIAVDVQVIDSNGNPIAQLGPESFEVSINGKRRKVASAQFVRHAELAASLGVKQDVSPTAEVERVLSAATARTLVLAVDNASFSPGETQPAMEAATDFLKHLDPNDLAGLYVYPTSLWIEPTTLRAPLTMKLQNLVGEKQPLRSYYNLKPHDIVDITAQSSNPNSFLLTSARLQGIATPQTTARSLDPVLKIQARECPDDPDCASKIYAEGMSLATQLERETSLSMGGLESLLRTLAEKPGRKSVVLITGGLLVSDRLDGRPDPGNVARAMGQAAARAQATVYTVHVDASVAAIGMPASRKGNGDSDVMRDRAMSSNWLEDFSRAAGGKRIDVPVGGGKFAFDQVLRETSAYYLLGVEPADADRDGLPRELKVKVDKRGVTVRNRQWVLIPRSSTK